jgi:hypothetical protein
MTPRLLDRKQAAAYCGISPNHFDAHVGSALQAIAIGRRRLWDIRVLDRFIDGLSAQQPKDDCVHSLMEALSADTHQRGQARHRQRA